MTVTVFRGLFTLWGVLGFVAASWAIYEVIQTSHTIVTAAATAPLILMGLLYWIGGMVFFAFGDLLNRDN